MRGRGQRFTRDAKLAVPLRERHKTKTRAAIQREALRLFREQGYQATTMEQIAAAAEVSPSTCFRYFPAKESLVLGRHYETLIAEALRTPAECRSPVPAIRGAARAVFAELGQDELAEMRERTRLTLAVPELRAAAFDRLAQAIAPASALATGQPERACDDFPVRNLIGAIFGVLIFTEFYWAEHPDADLVTLLDNALAHLEAGLPV